MKQISEYLSSKVKIQHFDYFNKPALKILEYFGISNKNGYINDFYDKTYDCVYSWCEENNITNENEVYPACDLETYNELNTFTNFKKIKDKFDTTYSENEDSQYELSKVKSENKVKINMMTSICYTNKMIACISTVGTIYCWKK